jgi:hypothetical protein
MGSRLTSRTGGSCRPSGIEYENIVILAWRYLLLIISFSRPFFSLFIHEHEEGEDNEAEQRQTDMI